MGHDTWRDSAQLELIGRVSFARETEVGAVGGRKSIFSMVTHDFVLFLFVIIELFPNNVFQLYYPKDYSKQKQWNTLPVKMITEIMNFNRLLLLCCHDIRRQVLSCVWRS